jgi:hypothetical protein
LIWEKIQGLTLAKETMKKKKRGPTRTAATLSLVPVGTKDTLFLVSVGVTNRDVMVISIRTKDGHL